VKTKALRALILALLTISLFSLVAQAQKVTFDGCRDINGYAVASVSNASIQDIAMATIANGNPVILYNPYVLANTRSQTRLFFYAHECGHHALGHTLKGLRLGQEQEADCWAINKLVELKLVSDQDISLIQADIARFGRGDWTHLPGPQRAISLRGCLDEDGSPEPPEPTHPKGHWELKECIHPLHPNGDAGPCQHVCWNAYRQAVPCHQADLYPCAHPAHANGDRVWVSD